MRPFCRPSVLLIVVVSLATACGASAGKTAAGPAAQASAAAASPSASPAALPPLSAATAQGIAVAAQLRAVDLPGYKEDKTAAGNAKAPTASDKQVQACVSGTPDPHYLADVTSSDFAKGTSPIAQLTVSSETQVVATTAQGSREFASLQKPATLACLNAALAKSFSSQAQGATFTGSLARSAAAVPAGADNAAGFVLAGAFHQQGVTIRLQVGLDLLLIGRAEVSLTVISLGSAPLPDSARDQLAAVLADRARTAQK